MGLLSASLSVARYRVEGETEESLLETVREGLTKNAISEIEDEYAEIAVGWTPFESPFDPDFEKFSYTFGTYFLFSLRIDKKTIPSKVLKKYCALEAAKRLAQTGRAYLSKDEKQSIKEHVTNLLNRRIPATPNVYDLLWNFEGGRLLFLSNLKAANEELETLFAKSFKLSLIRLFPFTMADLTADLSPADRDILLKLSPATFRE